MGWREASFWSSALCARHLTEQRTLLPEAVVRLDDGADSGLSCAACRWATDEAIRAGTKGDEVGHDWGNGGEGSA